MSGHTTTINNISNNEFRLDICREIPVDHTVFGSEGFKSVAWMRYEILKAIISSGRIAIYLDTDIVVRRNYESDILSYLQPSIGNEGVMQQNTEGFLCTGFFAFCPSANKKLQEIYSEKFLSQNNYKNYGTSTPHFDQEFFNKIVCPTNSNQLLRMQKLSRDLYPNGAYWYSNSKEIENISNIIHYNCIKGQNLKMLKMKHMVIGLFDRILNNYKK